MALANSFDGVLATSNNQLLGRFTITPTRSTERILFCIKRFFFIPFLIHVITRRKSYLVDDIDEASTFNTLTALCKFRTLVIRLSHLRKSLI